MDERRVYDATSAAGVIYIPTIGSVNGDEPAPPFSPLGVRSASLLPSEDPARAYLDDYENAPRADSGAAAGSGLIGPFKTFTWGTLTAGDCTMFSGATWTVYRHRSKAFFDAVVRSSDDDDAWVIWWVSLRDRDDVTLDKLNNSNPIPSDHNKFVQNLPDSDENYRFSASANYDDFGGLWDRIDHVAMNYSC